jgi:hypothetical protein
MVKSLHPYDWYMRYLFIWYFLFFIINLIKIDKDKKFMVMLFISMIMFFINKENIQAEQSASFVFGIYLSKRKRYFDEQSRKRFLIGAVLLFVGVFALAVKQLPIVRNTEIKAIYNLVQLLNKFGIGGGIIFLMYCIINFINLKWLYIMGIVSYELYLIHGYTIGLIEKYQSVKGYLLFLLLTALFSVILHYGNKLISNIFGRE